MWRRHNFSTLAAAALMLGVTISPKAQQAGQKASIAGSILHEGTDAPLAGVVVTVQQIRPSQLDAFTRAAAAGLTFNAYVAAATALGTPPPRAVPDPNSTAESSPILVSVLTDEQGRFRIPDLAEGSYMVNASMDGYAPQNYGQLAGALAVSMPVRLSPGEERKDIVLHLTQTGSVSGRVLDNSGRPAVGTPVQILRVSYNVHGQRFIQRLASSNAVTNDRGDYRLFWITPGQYYLVAGDDTSEVPDHGPSSPTMGTSPNEVPGQEFAMAFYPGVPDIEEATTFNVPSGQDLKGVDFRVRLKQPHSIRGRAVDATTGTPPPVLTAQLRSVRLGGAYSGLPTTVGYNPATGDFEVANVFSGSYEMYAITRGLSTRVSVRVGDGDLNGVAVTFAKPAPLTAHIRVDGLSPLAPQAVDALDSISVLLNPSQNGMPMPEDSFSAWSEDSSGSLTFSAVTSGEFRVALTDLPREFYWKEATYQGRDALNDPIVFAAGSTDPLEITISPNAAQLSGTVLDGKQQPAAMTRVVLVPDQHRNRTDLFQIAVTDARGRFSIAGIAPGDYKLFAWQSLEAFSYFDPQVLKRYDDQALAIHLEESAKQALQLKLIPAGQ